LGIGGGGSGCVAIGTQPIAAARANGNHAATEAMLDGGIFLQGSGRASVDFTPSVGGTLYSRPCRVDMSKDLCSLFREW